MTTDTEGATSADDRVGSMLADRYRIEAIVGRGGMSVVYRAADTFLGRTVAIKVFRPELADAEDLKRQQGEVQLLASLNHSTLVTLFDAILDPAGRVSLVLEYVPGRDLRDELASGPMDQRMTALVGADIAEALAYVHERGVIHRDLKPGNVLVPNRSPGETGPRAKLADFGIARLVDGTRLTAAGSVLGTAGYLSPEQAMGEAIGPASDVYSLGLVLLECLTGVRAFEGSGIESAMARLARDPEIPASLGTGWGNVLSRMTRREPSERVEARDLIADLRELAASSTGLEPDPTKRLDPTKRYESVEAESIGSESIGAESIGSDAATVRLSTTESATESATAETVAYAAATPPRNTTAPAAEPVPAGRRRWRRWVSAPIALLIVGSAVWAFFALGSIVPEEQPPVEYPVVEGDLGSHLEQLQRSVEP